MSYTTHISIAFGDTDPAGLVYYPNIFHYCHVAMERFVAELFGLAYSQLITEQRIGFPTVRVNAEFFVPIVYGDDIDVEVHVVKIGNSSLDLSYSIKRASDQTVCAHIEQTHVTMNLDQRKPLPIPPQLRQALTSAK